MIPHPIHFMATKRHKKQFLPADVCVAPIGARVIHAGTPDNFCAFAWLKTPVLGFSASRPFAPFAVNLSLS